ncbi:MAG TPA: S-adenosylmethionine decarboxylase [Gemmatimonadaceae bacterium]|nr:S-adenosylmethionine decarboxylase [Gemmatimonadaceae bacterium]
MSASPDRAAGRAPERAPVVGFGHLTADFLGVAPTQLRDVRLLSGLLIAAAGAAGFAAIAAPHVRELPSGGVAGWLQLDDCHLALHAFPDRELLLLDVLSLATHDGRKALDVFTRRLRAREVRSELRQRG